MPPQLKEPEKKDCVAALHVADSGKPHAGHQTRMVADWPQPNHFTRAKGKRDAIVLFDPFPFPPTFDPALLPQSALQEFRVGCESRALTEHEVRFSDMHDPSTERQPLAPLCLRQHNTNKDIALHFAPTCRPQTEALGPAAGATSARETMNMCPPRRRIRRPVVSAMQTQETTRS